LLGLVVALARPQLARPQLELLLEHEKLEREQNQAHRGQIMHTVESRKQSQISSPMLPSAVAQYYLPQTKKPKE
jgi:hypothetical protein